MYVYVYEKIVQEKSFRKEKTSERVFFFFFFPSFLLWFPECSFFLFLPIKKWDNNQLVHLEIFYF